MKNYFRSGVLCISRIKSKFVEFYLKLSISYVCGKKFIDLNSDEAVVCCLLKNGEYYINCFIDHYTKMGFKHIFLLDNSSTDKTVEIARRFDNVTVYSTKASVGKYQRVLKKILSSTTSSGGWCLDVDIDEMFDYPYSDRVNLAEFLFYLNKHNYSAVVSQMLDMFSEHKMSHLLDTIDEDIKSVYVYYDLTSVEIENYSDSNIVKIFAPCNLVSNNKINIYYGGIRKSLYGLRCLLTKHSLFRINNKLEIFPHSHFVNSANLADVSAVLYHYKLTSGALATSIQNRDSFAVNNKGYSDFISLINDGGDCFIVNADSRKINNTNELIDASFVVVSCEYKMYVDSL